MIKSLLTLFALAMLTLPLRAEFRTWTSTAGTTVEAELVDNNFTTVTLRLKDGRTLKVERSKISAADQGFLPETRLTILPVFFIPKGEPMPSAPQKASLLRHLEWAQSRYLELLDNKDTFEIDKLGVQELKGTQKISFYKKRPEDGVPDICLELLAWQKSDSKSCRFIFLVIVMNMRERFPVEGGRPFNGGINTGGGISIASSYALDQLPFFQSTLQHELGHAFGLVHVDCYGYDMKTSESIMSYNVRHSTAKFSPSPNPGIFIPEDLLALARNKKVFPNYTFDKGKIPSNYRPKPTVYLGPMTLP